MKRVRIVKSVLAGPLKDTIKLPLKVRTNMKRSAADKEDCQKEDPSITMAISGGKHSLTISLSFGIFAST